MWCSVLRGESERVLSASLFNSTQNSFLLSTVNLKKKAADRNGFAFIALNKLVVLASLKITGLNFKNSILQSLIPNWKKVKVLNSLFVQETVFLQILHVCLQECLLRMLHGEGHSLSCVFTASCTMYTLVWNAVMSKSLTIPLQT